MLTKNMESAMNKKHVIEIDPKVTNPYKAVNADKKEGQFVVKDKNTGKVLKVLTKCGQGKTDQSYKEYCQIKHLVSQTEAKGLLRASQQFEGQMDDLPDIDFQQAQFMVAKAQSMFEAMPSGIRANFENSPAKFMDFINNPDNAQAVRDMGLAKGLDGKKLDGSPTGAAPAPEGGEVPPPKPDAPQA